MEFGSILELLDNFPDEETCRLEFENIRWGGEVKCPFCQGSKIWRFKNTRILKCSKCQAKFSATVGTVFESTHVPLRKWFIAVYLLTSHKKGISSVQLSKDIDV